MIIFFATKYTSNTSVVSNKKMNKPDDLFQWKTCLPITECELYCVVVRRVFNLKRDYFFLLQFMVNMWKEVFGTANQNNETKTFCHKSRKFITPSLLLLYLVVASTPAGSKSRRAITHAYDLMHVADNNAKKMLLLLVVVEWSW